MKNIHILPTDKPSRLYLFKGRLILGDLVTVVFKNSGAINQHIYITSDEEIKVGDWFLPQGHINPHKLKEYNKINGDLESYNGLCYDISKCKKIILTTDTDLIKDGVQAIDDEFLEWFVKNPSCEWVEAKLIEEIHSGFTFGMFGNDEPPTELVYKIIIPKEEPKQIYYNTVGIENGVNVVKGQFNTQKEALDLANELNRKFPDLYYDWRETLIKEKPKQDQKPMKQTAVEWLIEQFEQSHSYINEIFKETIEQAKAMEKEQIMDAWNDGNCNTDLKGNPSANYAISAEHYYNQEYVGNNEQQ